MNWMKIWGDKKKQTIIYMILLVGVLLLIFGSMGHEKESPRLEAEESVILPDTELRLSEMLSQIEGAGAVSVMITYADDGEKIYASDTRSTSGTTETQAIMETESGKTHPFVVKETVPRVQGVIIIADGGDSLAVQEKLKEAVTAVLPVYPHNIAVYAREQNRRD